MDISNLWGLLGNGNGASPAGVGSVPAATGTGTFDLTPEQQAGLLNFGANMLAASRGQPGQGRPSFGDALGAGLQGYTRGIQSAQANQIAQIKMAQAKREAEREKMRDQLIYGSGEGGINGGDGGLLGSLPPDQRALAAAAPDEFIKANINAKFASPPSEVQGYNLARQQGYGGSFLDYQIAKKRAGASSVTTNVDTTGNAFAKEFGKQNADQFFDQQGKARDAAQSLQANTQALKLLDNGMYTGTGANWQMQFGKGLQRLGVNLNPDAIANTEAYGAQRAQEVGRIIKLFGAGTGLSDADREFAQKAAAGDITMTEQSLRRILEMSNRANHNIITNYNKRAETIPGEMSPYPLVIDVPGAGDNSDDALVNKYLGSQ